MKNAEQQPVAAAASIATPEDGDAARMRPSIIRPPLALVVAGCFVAGVRAGEFVTGWELSTLVVAVVLLMTSVVTTRRVHANSRITAILLMLAVIAAGAARWAIRTATLTSPGLAALIDDGHLTAEAPLRMAGLCSSIPARHALRDRPGHAEDNPATQTVFLFEADHVSTAAGRIEACGRCKVVVEGDATTSVRWGDTIELLGFATRPQAPQNPGEFDYHRYAGRHGIPVTIYVRHPQAIRVTRQTALPDLRGPLNDLRQQTVQLLEQNLTPESLAIAEALLLGNRGHMSPEVERDFVASGTLHLLAISGLHVGILYVFLVRVLNVLLVPRVPALMAAGLVCVLYAYLTDQRPSVVRATVFIQLLIAAQILRREVRMGSLIGVTTLLLVVMDPAIAFDSGAWLSFLAVGALGWVSFRTPPPRDEHAPPENIIWQERLHARISQAGGWLRGSYRKMLTVTLLSAPLIAVQFHLVSLTGMVLNVVLIPYSAAVLIAGYVFVGLGHLMPFAAGLLRLPFEYGLQGMNGAVKIAADSRFGFLMIPDLPRWFLPAYYGLLLASCVARRGVWRQRWRVALVTLVLIQFHTVCQRPVISETRCTVLSVGHGNAVLVESPQFGVVLFDAGALSRAERAADIISRCLWNRGHRMIDAIVVSHADADHYNALPPLLELIPVGQIITTPQFVRSDAKEVVDLLAAVEKLGVPVALAFSGDSVASSTADLSTRFLQASKDAADGDDNGSSLVAMLTTPHAEFCLPGDLDGEGQRELLPALRRSQGRSGSERPRFLVAPHHGSRGSNPREFATAVAADTVIISSRDDVNADAMRAVYAPGKVWFTALDGAVTIGRGESGAMEVKGFVTGREDDRRREREGVSVQDDESE